MASTRKTAQQYARLHLQFGWWCLLGFLSLGLVLDYFHAFKVGWYLDVGNETRRLMGTLAHAHGTLLGGVNIAFAMTVHVVGERMCGACRWASPCLLSASLLMPLGFLLSGIFTLKGEPGLGVFLVPVGGLLLLVGVGLAAVAIREMNVSVDRQTDDKKAKHRKR